MVLGNRFEETMGFADDDGSPADALSYRAAVVASLDWGRRQYAGIQARAEADRPEPSLTVKSAIEAYVITRKARSARDGANAEGRLRRHVIADEQFASRPLRKLRVSDFDGWRARREIGPSTLNRAMNDLRAALNLAYEKHHSQLPPNLPSEIRFGTRALPAAANARKQILDDKQVAAAVEAAFAIDAEGDFGRLVLVAAATGARHSQLRALTVADVQVGRLRIMVPGSRKGRARKPSPPTAVPVSKGVIDRLADVLDGRSPDEPLLTTWGYRRDGGIRWVKHRRRPWGEAFETIELWQQVVERTELPSDTVMYALRHTSIVRGLRMGLPVRLVAALHDTSSEMIEKHYAAFIVDATEELSRRAVLPI